MPGPRRLQTITLPPHGLSIAAIASAEAISCPSFFEPAATLLRPHSRGQSVRVARAAIGGAARQLRPWVHGRSEREVELTTGSES